MGWDTICKPKKEGGLGIRPLKQMNLALLGKWLWRIGEGLDGLWRHVLERKYGRLRHGWEVKDTSMKSSALSKGILSVKNHFMKNIKYHIGSGEGILF